MLSPLRASMLDPPAKPMRRNLLHDMNIGSTLDRRTPPPAHTSLQVGLWLLLSIGLLVGSSVDVQAKAKPNRAPRPEPELKILDLTVAPNPYSPAAGPLTFSAIVQLPKELNGATLLEFSSFVTSPSKTSIRFLTTRTALAPHSPPAEGSPLPRTTVALTWDGLDHKKGQAGTGLYRYEIRAKLLANGEKGPRTMMVAWPKRGMLEVK